MVAFCAYCGCEVEDAARLDRATNHCVDCVRHTELLDVLRGAGTPFLKIVEMDRTYLTLRRRGSAVMDSNPEVVLRR